MGTNTILEVEVFKICGGQRKQEMIGTLRTVRNWAHDELAMQNGVWMSVAEARALALNGELAPTDPLYILMLVDEVYDAPWGRWIAADGYTATYQLFESEVEAIDHALGDDYALSSRYVMEEDFKHWSRFDVYPTC